MNLPTPNPDGAAWRLSRRTRADAARARGTWTTGFTLIEMLLAVAIFAIVLVAIHTVFYGALRLSARTTESVEQGLPLQQSLAILQRDLANLVLPSGTFFGELQTSQSATGSTNTLNVLSPVNDAIIGQSSPAFFTATGVVQEGAPWGDIVRVAYYLTPSTNQTPGKDLIRSVTRNLLPVMQEQPENQWLMGGLQSIAFSYYDGLQWREYWDSTTETNKLPFGIKVQLQMVPDTNDRSRRDPVELVVPIVVRPGTNETETATGGAQ